MSDVARYPSIESATKPRLDLESAHSVTIYRRMRRVVVEYPDGVRASWTFPTVDHLNRAAILCAPAGLQLGRMYGCAERWVRG